MLLGLVVACTGGTAGPAASPSPLTYQQLAARPLKLPDVATGQPCSTSTVRILGGTAPRMGKPVGFGFGVRNDGSPWPTGGYALNKTVWDFIQPLSPPDVLLRGRRVDGPGALYFGGGGISNPELIGITITDAQGHQVPFFPQLRLPVDSNAAFYTYPTTVGCFAIQADSGNFSEMVVFKAI